VICTGLFLISIRLRETRHLLKIPFAKLHARALIGDLNVNGNMMGVKEVTRRGKTWIIPGKDMSNDQVLSWR
jgi:hypothetical protein